MKIQNILRTQAIVIGFGAALLLSSPAPAQEIVNTQFDDGPYVTTFAQPSPTVTTDVAPASTVADASTVSPAIAIPTPVVTDEAVVSLENSAAYGLITSALFGLALLAVFAVGEFRRANRNLTESPSSPLRRRVALS
ncbi:MAG TPA: hypothetical protein VJX72_14750 [Candidatus Acidoferrum sp.]|nr:hypothetical protein [Candidatus Acidoferrum sp.]